MPLLSADPIPEVHCAPHGTTRGIAWRRGPGRRVEAGCGAATISTAGLLAESDRNVTHRCSFDVKDLPRAGRCGRPQVRRVSGFTGRIDYLVGNNSSICPGGSGHLFD